MKVPGKKRAPSTRTRTPKSNGAAAPLASLHESTTISLTQESEDDVAQLAHRLFVERGGTDGHDVDDWLEAERRLRSKDA